MPLTVTVEARTSKGGIQGSSIRQFKIVDLEAYEPPDPRAKNPQTGKVIEKPSWFEKVSPPNIPDRTSNKWEVYSAYWHEYWAWIENWVDEGYVCAWNDGAPVKPNYISQRFKAIIEKHKLPHIRFHDLRHTNATLLLEQNVNLKWLSEWLGHSNFNGAEGGARTLTEFKLHWILSFAKHLELPRNHPTSQEVTDRLKPCKMGN